MFPSTGGTPVSHVVERNLEEANDLYTALTATGMDAFGAVELAAAGNLTLTPPLWMRALRLVGIPAGSFRMGPRKAGQNVQVNKNKGSLHTVRIPYPFQVGAVPVTQGAWIAIMGNMRQGPMAAIHGAQYYRPGDDPNLPAVDLTFEDLCAPNCFLDRLNAITEGARPKGHDFRLPSEEEWEYACRAGTTSRWSFGDELEGLDAHAWSVRNSGGVLHPVGRMAPNPWGLYDMHGNVHERCLDRNDPFGIGLPQDHIVRGGSFRSLPLQCLAASSEPFPKCRPAKDVGFRVVLSQLL
jgi:formylglycine-generating enzyme required for sulfatase activity